MVIDGGTIRLRPPTPTDAREWLAGEDDELARWSGTAPSDAGGTFVVFHRTLNGFTHT
jgi:hypothetical protein